MVGCFNPVALVFRLSPVVFSGIFLSFWLVVRNWRQWTMLRRAKSSQNNGLLISLLLVWSFLFIVGISIATKKFDRYALPVFPALSLVAAFVWGQAIVKKWRSVQLGILLPVAVQIIYLFAFIPYPLAAYNWLVGGPQVAQRAMPLGWGEGISAGGRWLAEQPDFVDKTAVSATAPALAPFF